MPCPALTEAWAASGEMGRGPGEASDDNHCGGGAGDGPKQVRGCVRISLCRQSDHSTDAHPECGHYGPESGAHEPIHGDFLGGAPLAPSLGLAFSDQGSAGRNCCVACVRMRRIRVSSGSAVSGLAWPISCLRDAMFSRLSPMGHTFDAHGGWVRGDSILELYGRCRNMTPGWFAAFTAGRRQYCAHYVASEGRFTASAAGNGTGIPFVGGERRRRGSVPCGVRRCFANRAWTCPVSAGSGPQARFRGHEAGEYSSDVRNGALWRRWSERGGPEMKPAAPFVRAGVLAAGR